MGMQANVFSPNVVVLKLWWFNPFLGLCPNFIFLKKKIATYIFCIHSAQNNPKKTQCWNMT